MSIAESATRHLDLGLPSRERITRWAVFALGSALVALIPGCLRDSAPKKANVILICLDAVRADRLGCYGYTRHPTTPHLDELARQSILFEDASAAACWTKPSVPSFLTGTWPLQHGVYEGSAHKGEGKFADILPQKSATLAEAFDRRGWSTAAFVENDLLRRGSGIEQGFGFYDDDAGDARRIRWRALDWIDARPRERPFFLYLHFLDAHMPYAVPDEYAHRFAPDAPIGLLLSDDWRAVRDAINDGERKLSAGEEEGLGALYDGAIRSVDDQLGLLFEALELRGLREDTVVCVVADHGEEFLEHGRLGHGHGLYQNLLRVPWVLRAPGRSAARIASPVSLIDLAPTLLGAAGLTPQDPLPGVDRLAKPDAPAAIFAEHKEPGAYEQAYRVGSWKLVRRFVPPAHHGPAAQVAGRLIPGTRWKADIEVLPGGGLRARRLKPSDEPSADPAEIKGAAGRIDAASFDLGGLTVRLAPSTTFYGAVTDKSAEKGGLREGTMVKAVGAFAGDAFVAKKVKLYAPSEPRDFEVRGTIAAVEGSSVSGRLRVDQAWIQWDARTEWELAEPAATRRNLAREDLVKILELGGSGAAEAGFVVETRLYDLSSDPGEARPVKDPGQERQLGEALDSFGRIHSRTRSWGPADRLLLDAETIQHLKALGYVK